MRFSTVVRWTVLAVFALCAAPVALELSFQAFAAEKPRVERPVYKLGDKWIRTDGMYYLVRIDKDVYVFSAGPGKEIHLTKDLGIVKVVRDGRVEIDIEPPPKFTWPLEVGKWGVGRAVWRSAVPRPLVNFTGSINITWQVDAYEDVATAAGTFRALRITEKIETVPEGFGGSGQQFGQVFLWYAPEIQRFVKAQGNLNGLNWELGGAPPPVVASPPTGATAPPPAAPAPPRPEPAAPPRSVAAVPRGDTEAPKITINSPLPDARLSEEKVLVTGLITDDVEVVRVQVLVNGVEAPSLLDAGVVGRGVPVGVLAPLKPGHNSIEILATDRVGNVAQVVLSVTRVPGKPR